ncbi:DUF6431 domain-containing protein [Sporomusa ovata]|uniref:DUF6431 domain-containing protein n=1 Tax=Sporomusa ovata TaxID=2378 RepID=UPI001C6FCC40|nr:DUF6431 domain-containing protein [Sporomusa ovata]
MSILIRIFLVSSKILSVCPHCSTPLSCHDHRVRYVKLRCGIRVALAVPRGYCAKCQRLHTELPSFVRPYKHYEASVMQDVVDDKSLMTCPADDSTIRRWKAEFSASAPYIETLLHAACAKKVPLFGEPLLAILRRKIRRWSILVTPLLCASDFYPATQFALVPPG